MTRNIDGFLFKKKKLFRSEVPLQPILRQLGDMLRSPLNFWKCSDQGGCTSTCTNLNYHLTMAWFDTQQCPKWGCRSHPNMDHLNNAGGSSKLTLFHMFSISLLALGLLSYSLPLTTRIIALFATEPNKKLHYSLLVGGCNPTNHEALKHQMWRILSRKTARCV